MDYIEYYGLKPKRNVAFELLNNPNKFTLDELRIMYEELTDISLELPTREVFIFLILNYLKITTFKSKLNKRHVMEYGQVLDLYLGKVINCVNPQLEMVAAYLWLYRTNPPNKSISFLRKKIIIKIASFEDNTK
jgi:hypothetical protein